MIPLVNGPIQAILQATVAPEFQGRIFTLYGSLAGLTVPLGLLVAAPVADLAGVHVWYYAGGVTCVMTGIAGFFMPSIWRIESDVSATSEHSDRVPDEPSSAKWEARRA